MTAETVPFAPVTEGWTIEDVDALPEDGTRWELVDGVPRAMTPARTKHQRAQRRLANAIEATAPGSDRHRVRRGDSGTRPTADPRPPGGPWRRRRDVQLSRRAGQRLVLTHPFPISFDQAILLK